MIHASLLGNLLNSNLALPPSESEAKSPPTIRYKILSLLEALKSLLNNSKSLFKHGTLIVKLSSLKSLLTTFNVILFKKFAYDSAN